MNLLNWSANKVKRVVHSAFAAETLGCIDALSDAVYCRQLASKILYNQPESRVIEIFGFVDNMQLFDQISSTKQCSDKRISQRSFDHFLDSYSRHACGLFDQAWRRL